MHPDLARFGPITLGGTHYTIVVPSYGSCLAIALLIGWLWLHHRGLRLNVSSKSLFWTVCIAVVCGLVGGRIGAYLVVAARGHLGGGRFDVLGGGAGIEQGAILTGIFAAAVAWRLSGLPLLALADAAAAPLALAQGFARLGCYMGGCCYGIGAPSWLPWASTFVDPAAKLAGVPLGVRLVPIQLIQLFVGLALAWLLVRLDRCELPQGDVFAAYLVLSGGTRVILEFLRGDADRGIWFGSVSTGQVLGMVFVFAGVALKASGVLRSRSIVRNAG